eukprot:gnl/TRDRNA2_/TRDRNA2_85505_c0_seq1.p1 gnl/TRDRNA2_/TRDRNA2_85505_c0~~gnl/TRDRNA2_/TRDRNA2_85505_c0_seq1.p1  ORF type:complete len:566 (+),score=148.06 gnl/TRDRNA2_/TRDRNA2_85505_c0_seq1:130-1698(+)
MSADGPGLPLAERVGRLQEDLKALSRYVKSEATTAKKLAQTPMWKERALQEFAQQELRKVCIEEVSRSMQEFTATFAGDLRSKEQPASQRGKGKGKGDKGDQTQLESSLRAEMTKISTELNRQIEELSKSCQNLSDDGSTMNTRVVALEEKQTELVQDRLESVVKMQRLMEDAKEGENANSESAAAYSSYRADRVAELESVIDSIQKRVAISDARRDDLEARCGTLHASLSNEAAERSSDTARLQENMTAFSALLEDERAARLTLQGVIEESARKVCLGEVQKVLADQVPKQLEGQQKAESNAAIALQASESMVARCESVLRLAEEASAQAKIASMKVVSGDSSGAGAAASKEATDALLTMASQAREAAERSDAQANRYGEYEERFSGLQRRLEMLGGRLDEIGKDMENGVAANAETRRQLREHVEQVEGLRVAAGEAWAWAAEAPQRKLEEHERRLGALDSFLRSGMVPLTTGTMEQAAEDRQAEGKIREDAGNVGDRPSSSGTVRTVDDLFDDVLDPDIP